METLETRDELVFIIIDKLENLAYCNYENDEELRDNAEDFLFELYFAGVRNIEYTDDEKETIVSLFPLAAKALKEHLSDLSIRFSEETVRSLKLQRYGFQFLFNLLKECAAKLEDKQKKIILEETIDEIIQSEDMAELDQQVENPVFTEFDYWPALDAPNPFLTS